MPRKRKEKPAEIDKEIQTGETHNHTHQYNPHRSDRTSINMGHSHRVTRMANASIYIGQMDGHRHTWK